MVSQTRTVLVQNNTRLSCKAAIAAPIARYVFEYYNCNLYLDGSLHAREDLRVCTDASDLDGRGYLVAMVDSLGIIPIDVYIRDTEYLMAKVHAQRQLPQKLLLQLVVELGASWPPE